MLSFALTILLDGISYGMVLFIISVGLTITMGLMRVAQPGARLVCHDRRLCRRLPDPDRAQISISRSLAAAVIPGALGGVAAEVTVYRPLYRKGELAQVLLTIGIVFVVTAAVTEISARFPIR